MKLWLRLDEHPLGCGVPRLGPGVPAPHLDAAPKLGFGAAPGWDRSADLDRGVARSARCAGGDRGVSK